VDKNTNTISLILGIKNYDIVLAGNASGDFTSGTVDHLQLNNNRYTIYISGGGFNFTYDGSNGPLDISAGTEFTLSKPANSSGPAVISFMEKGTSTRIKNVSMPVDNTDAANKEYVDAKQDKFAEVNSNTIISDELKIGKIGSYTGDITYTGTHTVGSGSSNVGQHVVYACNFNTDPDGNKHWTLSLERGGFNFIPDDENFNGIPVGTTIVIDGECMENTPISITAKNITTDVIVPTILSGVDTPIKDNDAANKAYVDNQLVDLNEKINSNLSNYITDIETKESNFEYLGGSSTHTSGDYIIYVDNTGSSKYSITLCHTDGTYSGFMCNSDEDLTILNGKTVYIDFENSKFIESVDFITKNDLATNDIVNAKINNFGENIVQAGSDFSIKNNKGVAILLNDGDSDEDITIRANTIWLGDIDNNWPMVHLRGVKDPKTMYDAANKGYVDSKAIFEEIGDGYSVTTEKTTISFANGVTLMGDNTEFSGSEIHLNKDGGTSIKGQSIDIEGDGGLTSLSISNNKVQVWGSDVNTLEDIYIPIVGAATPTASSPADQVATKEYVDTLDNVLKDIRDAIRGGGTTEQTVAQIEQLITNYLETKTVAEVEE
jgi:hypothetical protein